MLHAQFVFFLGMLSCSDLISDDDQKNVNSSYDGYSPLRDNSLMWKVSWFTGFFSKFERTSGGVIQLLFFSSSAAAADPNRINLTLIWPLLTIAVLRWMIGRIMWASLQRQRERMCVVRHRPSWGIQLHFAYCSQIMSHWKGGGCLQPTNSGSCPLQCFVLWFFLAVFLDSFLHLGKKNRVVFIHSPLKPCTVHPMH